MIRIAICEDENSSLAILMAMLEEYKNKRTDLPIEVEPYDSSTALLQQLRLGMRYDIYFLDIYMEETDGISVAEYIRKLDTKAKLVFTTSSKEHALDAFRVNATQYLLKPIDKSALKEVMDHMTAGYQRAKSVVILNTSKGKCSVALEDILYCEYYQHIVTFHLTEKRDWTSKSLRVPFSVAVANLLSNRNFVQPHKSYVVNLNHVVGYAPTKFILDRDDIEVPISKSFREAARVAYISLHDMEPVPET